MLIRNVFAYDTLIVCSTDPEHLDYPNCVLLCLKAVSGLKINLSNSKMVPIGEVLELPSLAENWVANFPNFL